MVMIHAARWKHTQQKILKALFSQVDSNLNKKCDIRILHVTPWFPPHKAGIANYVSNLCTQLVGQGYEIAILTVKRLGEKAYFNNNNVSTGHQTIEYMNCFYLPGWPFPTLRSVSIPIDAGAKIQSRIRMGNFDIVHVHGLHYPICWLAIYLARKYRVRSVLSLHATYPILDPSKETNIEKWLYRHIFSRTLSQADTVIGPAESITSFAQKYQRGSSTHFQTVEYGLDIDRFAPNLNKKLEFRKKYDISESAIVLMFSGRLERIKGILEFGKAAKKIVEESSKGVEAIIIGSGTLKDQVYSIVRNTTGIHLFDWQPEEKIHEFYIASDIIVVPSRSEGMPITILEAMNAGLHIVFAPVGGIPDILKGYPSKTSIKEISHVEIYNVLLKLISSDLGNADRLDCLTYAQSFDWKHISKEITSVYAKLIS